MLQVLQQLIDKFCVEQAGGGKGQGNTEALTGYCLGSILEELAKYPTVKRLA